MNTAPPGMTTATVTYEVPDLKTLDRKAKGLEGMVDVFVNITTDDEYQMAGDELTSAQSFIKKLEEQRTAITKPQNEALRAVNDMFRGPRERAERVVASLKQAMLTYSSRVQLEREAAQAAADAETAKQKKALADEAAQVQAQAAEKVATLKQQAGADGELTDEQVAEVRAIEEAAQAEAQALQTAAEVVTGADVARPLPKAFKTAILSRDVVEVTDPMAFLRYIVAEKPELLELVSFDQKRLDLAAKAFGGKLPWPGVTVHKKQSMRAGSK